MEKIKNAKRDLALIVADIIKAENSHDEKMAKLVTEALANYSQRQLLKALTDKGIKISQAEIARYGAIGQAIKKGKGLNVENVLTALRTSEIAVSDVKSWGKNVPQEFTKPRESRATGGITKQTSNVDKVRKSLETTVKNAKQLSPSEKAKLKDLALELISVLGVVPAMKLTPALQAKADALADMEG